MKKLFLTIAAVGLLSLSAKAQGDFQFDNITGTPTWTISDQFGVLIPAGATDFFVEAYWGAGAGVAANLLQPTGAIATGGFWTGAGGFYFGTGTIATGTQGQTITLQMRAWQGGPGSTYESQLVAGATGKSGTVTYVTPTAPNLPNPLDGLSSFQLSVIPEPSTIALAGLGAVALLAIRRRK